MKTNQISQTVMPVSNELKKFNASIQIEIEVDMIAQQLLKAMDPEFKHSTIVVESIVGRMMQDNSLSFLYNSLNGYKAGIDFTIGEVVVAKEDGTRVYGFWTADSITRNDTVYGNVTRAVVKNVNPYANEKLCIEFAVPQKDGSSKFETKWVNHTKWNRI